ncbi:MAG: hypothetical protein WCT31_00950 [Candidatus Micrarchaeia archaeon]|jgi:hypothetical protein
MKVCFFFNWEFSRMCHALAKYIKEKDPDSSFSGVMVQRKELNWVKSQGEINYDLIVLEELFNKYKSEQLDEKLIEQYEKKYANPSLWEWVYADRDLSVPFSSNAYSHDDLRKMVQVLVREFEGFLKKNKPDFLVFDCIASLPAFALYNVAKKMDIQTVTFTYSRAEDRVYFVSNPYDKPDEVLSFFKEIRKNGKRPKKAEEEALAFLERFRSQGVKPKYIQNMAVSEKNIFSLKGHVARFFEYWKEYYLDGYSNDYTFKGKNPFKRTYEKAAFFTRKKMKYKSYFEPAVEGESFAFFPLHLDPELATMVQAPPYVDQAALIRTIARALPMNMKLYVKEHPLMFSRGWRAPKFYEAIKKIPNVRLVDPNLSAREMIQKSKLVLTITGTAGFEALLYQKPMICFGEAMYTDMEFVVKAKNLLDLPKIIASALSSYRHDEKELTDFLVALYHKSVPINLALLMGYVYPNITAKEIFENPDFKLLADYMHENVLSKRKA